MCGAPLVLLWLDTALSARRRRKEGSWHPLNCSARYDPDHPHRSCTRFKGCWQGAGRNGGVGVHGASQVASAVSGASFLACSPPAPHPFQHGLQHPEGASSRFRFRAKARQIPAPLRSSQAALARLGLCRGHGASL
jgi:hypothetical protein